MPSTAYYASDSTDVTSVDTGQVWSGWCQTLYTATTSITSASTNQIWQGWVDQTSGGSGLSQVWNNWVQETADYTYNTTTVWNNWVGQLGQQLVQLGQQLQQSVQYNIQYNQVAETPEQRAVRERAERQVQEEYRQVRLRETKAAQRAERLLHKYLTEEQKKQLDEKGEFEVVSESGKLYAIRKGHMGNVYSLDEHRRRIASHCIHPIDNVADHDAMLSQMIWLRWNEKEFLKVANRTPVAA